MGRVINEEEARHSVCNCNLIDPDKPPTPENLLCHSDGVIGFLTDRQDRRLCRERHVEGPLGNVNQQRKYSLLSVTQDVCTEKGVPTKKCAEEAGNLMEKEYSRKEIEEKLAKKYGVEVD